MKQPLLIPIWYKDSEAYQVFEDYIFVTRGESYIVPKGLVVDGASVPRMLWWFKPPDGEHRAAALAHDWLYLNKGVMPGRTFTRRDCDQVFHDLLLQSGLSDGEASLLFAGVRLGGWVTWRKSSVGPVILPIINARQYNALNHPEEFQGHLYFV